MIKAGIIGTGFGSTQATCFNKLAGSKTEAICGADHAKTKRIAKKLNVQKVYKNYKELLFDKEIDVVSIATPNHLHKPMFLEALKHNKHIILEKPAGLNSKEINHMINASKNYTKLIIVDHPLRFNPITQYVIDTINSGKLGKIVQIRLDAYTNYVSAKDKSFIWIDYPKKGGGQILNMGTHLMDLSRFMLNMPKPKFGNIIKKTVLDSYPDKNGKEKNVDIEHQINANILWDNQVNTTFFNTTTSFGYKNFEIRVMGSKGIIIYDDIDGLRESYSNDQPLTKHHIQDPLQKIEVGRSFVSKSFKYFAKKLILYLEGKTEKLEFCTLEEALENMQYLENINQIN